MTYLKVLLLQLGGADQTLGRAYALVLLLVARVAGAAADGFVLTHQGNGHGRRPGPNA